MTYNNVSSDGFPLNPASLAELGQIIDSLEAEGGEKIGGPSSDIIAARDAIEEAIHEVPATTPADRLVLLRRLVQAEENDWTIEAKAPWVEALAMAYELEFAD